VVLSKETFYPSSGEWQSGQVRSGRGRGRNTGCAERRGKVRSRRRYKGEEGERGTGTGRGMKDLDATVLELSDLLRELCQSLIESLTTFALRKLELLDDRGRVANLELSLLQTHLELVVLCSSLSVTSLPHFDLPTEYLRFLFPESDLVIKVLCLSLKLCP
jgi:hypothetical protein